jgi:hypothetical protein
MEYSADDVKQFLKIYRDIHQISLAQNATLIYMNNHLEDLERMLSTSKEFPKEFYMGDKILEEDIKKSISLLEEAIGYHEEGLEVHKGESCRERGSKRLRFRLRKSIFNH